MKAPTAPAVNFGNIPYNEASVLRERPNSQFHSEFSRHVPISSEPSRIDNIWPIKKSALQRDVHVYLNKLCIYPMYTSENVRIYVDIGYIRNFCRQIDFIARCHITNDVFDKILSHSSNG